MDGMDEKVREEKLVEVDPSKSLAGQTPKSNVVGGLRIVIGLGGALTVGLLHHFFLYLVQGHHVTSITQTWFKNASNALSQIYGALLGIAGAQALLGVVSICDFNQTTCLLIQTIVLASRLYTFIQSRSIEQSIPTPKHF